MKTNHFMSSRKRLPLALAAVAMCGGALAQPVTVDASELRVLRDELRQLRQEIDALKARRPGAPAQNPVPVAQTPGATAGSRQAARDASARETADAPAPAVASAADSGASGSGVRLFGYGEMNYTQPRNNPSGSTATVRRGVLGFGYRFNESTRMAAELEIENAVVSKNDDGEAAFEQFYVEHDLDDKLTARAGLFLLPMGYLNQVHEPTRFYGVNRNLVETAIIPSTWRELGLGLSGRTDGGFKWDAGLTTSFDLTKWDASSNDGKDSPLGAIHQEGQKAKASNYGVYGALNFNGIPGFNVGASLFNAGVGAPTDKDGNVFAAPNARLTLGELHARWQPGTWDLSALAAMGGFSGVSDLNATYAGKSSPVPNRFGGWYAQAAKRVWRSGDRSLAPFLRYEQLNTALGYDGLGAQTPAIAADTRVWTAGLNFYLHPQVVFKFDVQQYLNDTSLSKLNLGVGFHF